MYSALLRLACYCLSVFMISSKIVGTASRFDIVLALDDSLYRVRTNAVNKVLPSFTKIGQGDEETRFGVVYCANPADSNTVWLNKCTNQKCLENEIDVSVYEKIPVYWKECLVVVRNLFEPHKGDRPNAANVVLAITDGLFDSDVDFTAEIQELVAIKNVTMFSLLVDDGGAYERVAPNMLKLANGNPEHMRANFEGLVKLLITTPGVGYVELQDCVLGIIELPCALNNGSCTKVQEFYVKIQPHKKGEQCPDPLPAANYTPCSTSDCSCLKPEFFEEPKCPTKNCDRDLRVNVSTIKQLFDECENVTYTWAVCPYICPTDQTESMLIIVLVVSIVLMVIVLTVLGLLVYRRRKRIAKRGYDSTTFTLGSKTPSTSKVATADAVVPVPVVDDSEKSSRRSSRSKRKPKPIKTYYHPESRKSVAKKTSVNVPLKESKSIGSPSSKLSSVVAKSPKSNVTSSHRKPNGKKSFAIVPLQPSKTGSLKGNKTATSKLKQSGSKSPQSNLSKGSRTV